MKRKACSCVAAFKWKVGGIWELPLSELGDRVTAMGDGLELLGRRE